MLMLFHTSSQAVDFLPQGLLDVILPPPLLNEIENNSDGKKRKKEKEKPEMPNAFSSCSKVTRTAGRKKHARFEWKYPHPCYLWTWTVDSSCWKGVGRKACAVTSSLPQHDGAALRSPSPSQSQQAPSISLSKPSFPPRENVSANPLLA